MVVVRCAVSARESKLLFQFSLFSSSLLCRLLTIDSSLITYISSVVARNNSHPIRLTSLSPLCFDSTASLALSSLQPCIASALSIRFAVPRFYHLHLSPFSTISDSHSSCAFDLLHHSAMLRSSSRWLTSQSSAAVRRSHLQQLQRRDTTAVVSQSTRTIQSLHQRRDLSVRSFTQLSAPSSSLRHVCRLPRSSFSALRQCGSGSVAAHVSRIGTATISPSPLSSLSTLCLLSPSPYNTARRGFTSRSQNTTTPPADASTQSATPPTYSSPYPAFLFNATHLLSNVEDKKENVKAIEIRSNGMHRTLEMSRVDLSKDLDLHPRDLRFLDASMRNMPAILARKKAIIVNMEVRERRRDDGVYRMTAGMLLLLLLYTFTFSDYCLFVISNAHRCSKLLSNPIAFSSLIQFIHMYKAFYNRYKVSTTRNAQYVYAYCLCVQCISLLCAQSFSAPLTVLVTDAILSGGDEYEHESKSVPFEFIALEYILMTVVSCVYAICARFSLRVPIADIHTCCASSFSIRQCRNLETRYNVYIDSLMPLLRDAGSGPVPHLNGDPNAPIAFNALVAEPSAATLMHLLQLKNSMSSFEVTLRETSGALQALLANDDDMCEMYLTRKDFASRENDVGYANTEHEEVELILETYLRKVDELENEVEQNVQSISLTEEHIQIRLDSIRNSMMKLELLGSLCTFGVTSAALGASLFGMNIPNHLEHSPYAFAIVATSFIVLSGLIIRAGLSICRNRNIHLLQREKPIQPMPLSTMSQDYYYHHAAALQNSNALANPMPFAAKRRLSKVGVMQPMRDGISDMNSNANNAAHHRNMSFFMPYARAPLRRNKNNSNNMSTTATLPRRR